MEEILEKRSYNTKHFDNGDGTFRVQSHVGHIHYKDGNGNFLDSDFSPVDQGTYWEMTKHNYTLRVAKDFAAPLLMQFTNKYEGANHTITYEPFSLAWYDSEANDVQQFRAQQSVQGVYNATKNSFYYTGAFGAGIDFEITIRRSGFKKEVVVPNKPNVFPTSPGAGYRLVALFKYGGSAVNVRDIESDTAWDNNSHLEGGQGFELGEANQLQKSFIKPAYGVDADRNAIPLKVMWRKRNNQLWQIKEIPLNAMEQATFPVRFDTVTNYYAGSADRNPRYWQSSSWANTRAGTGGVYIAEDTILHSEYLGATNKWLIGRFLYPIDTSGIGSGNTVTAATMYVYHGTQLNTTETTYPANAAIVGATFANPTSITDSDFTTAGTTRYADTDITIASLGASSYYSWVFNATGIAAIDKTGWTKLAMRASNDFSDSTAPTARSYSDWQKSEDANDPYLEVTYSAAGGVTVPRQRHTLLTLGVG